MFLPHFSVPPDSPADPVWAGSGQSTPVWFPRVLLEATGGGPTPASGAETASGLMDSTGDTGTSGANVTRTPYFIIGYYYYLTQFLIKCKYACWMLE